MTFPQPAVPDDRCDPGPVTLRAIIERELVPRMLTAHPAGPISPNMLAAAQRALGEAELAEFLRRVLDPDDARAGDFVAELRDEGASVDAVYMDLLAPTARRLGELWDEDSCDFLQVTIALGRMQRLLREPSQSFATEIPLDAPLGRILLGGAPGDQHTLGVLMVAEFFVRAGWGVAVGPPLGDVDLQSAVGQDWFDVIGLSLGTESRLDSVKRLIVRIRRASRNPNLVVLVGGRVFAESPDLAESVGADGSVADARLAPTVAIGLLRRQPHVPPTFSLSPPRDSARESPGRSV